VSVATPGKNVSVTKGRISIVWEGVNTFSDHYGKRLTLKLNVAKLIAKRNKQTDSHSRKGSLSTVEKDDTHERRPSVEEDNDGNRELSI
jgi:hypothetical protein